MGHVVDKDLLHLVQDEVRDLIKDYQTIESQVNLQNKQIDKVEEDVSTLKDQFASQEAGCLSTMEKKLQEFEKNRRRNRTGFEKAFVIRSTVIHATWVGRSRAC